MRRILTTFTMSTLVAGTVLLGTGAFSAPSVSSERFAPVAQKTCDIPQMRAEIRDGRNRAAALERLGAYGDAKKARAQADATERLMNACIASDENLSKPRWK
ncbi:hypothetical protein [Streptomyces sp.]|uniref:hypothetical protein n=1 Tax=Streptomyces sp. TaxID=1931 RepID=UPI002F957ACE